MLAVSDQTVREESSSDAGKDDSMKIGEATGEETTSPDEKTNNGAVCRVRNTVFLFCFCDALLSLYQIG